MAGWLVLHTVSAVNPVYEILSGTSLVRLCIPDLDGIVCFLERQRISFEEAESDDEFEEFEMGFEPDETVDDDFAEGDETLSVEEIDEDDAWLVAGMFGVGRYSPSWWLFDMDPGVSHGPHCNCRPLGLLEVMQYHAPVPDRQEALEAHLSALRDVWDHFWSGDALVNGASEEINGACSTCIITGREHLGDVLDEARNLAEELGEALAAFHSHIDIGTNRY